MAGGAAAAAAIAMAIKASGVLVRVEPQEFLKILARAEKPLVVTAEGGVFGKNYQYLLAYRGLAFFTKSKTPVTIPPDAETVAAASIWIPG